jgi:hypothetical protein
VIGISLPSLFLLSVFAVALHVVAAAQISCRYRRPELVDLGLQEIDRNQQRLDRLPDVAATSRDRLVGSRIQVAEFGTADMPRCSLFVRAESSAVGKPRPRG